VSFGVHVFWLLVSILGFDCRRLIQVEAQAHDVRLCCGSVFVLVSGVQCVLMGVFGGCMAMMACHVRCGQRILEAYV